MDGNETTINEKETYKANLKAARNDSTKIIITEHIEFDTVRNEYVVIKILNHYVTGVVKELKRLE